MTAWQADLSRGFGCYVERLLGRLPGVEIVLQHLFLAPESNPERKGWLITEQVWSLDQVLSMPLPGKSRLTHVLQGEVHWTSGEVALRMELIDLATGAVAATETTTGAQETLSRDFHRLLSNMAGWLVGPAAARALARPATVKHESFTDLLLALAAVQGWHHDMVKPQRAFSYFVRAIRRDPAHLTACEALESFARLCLEKGEKLAPLRALERLEAGVTPYPRFRALLGFQLLESGKEERAVPLLESYLEQEPRGEMASEVLETLAQIHTSREEGGRAREMLEEAVKANPENAAAWEKLGRCYLEDDQRARAEECWRRALWEDPDRLESLACLGMMHHSRGEFDKAVRLLERAWNLGGDRGLLLPRLVDALVRTGHLEHADEIATAWVEEEGESPDAWLSVGMARRSLGDYAAARHCAERIESVARDAMGRELACLLRFAIDHPDEYDRFCRLRDLVVRTRMDRRNRLAAVVYNGLERLAAGFPGFVVPWRLLAEVWEAGGKWREAIRARSKLAEFHPDDLGEQLLFGRATLKAGDAREAVVRLRRAIDAAAPEELGPEAFLLLGEAYLAAGHRREALEALQAALDRDPANTRVAALVEDLRAACEPIIDSAPVEPAGQKETESSPSRDVKETASRDSGALRRLIGFLRREKPKG